MDKRRQAHIKRLQNHFVNISQEKVEDESQIDKLRSELRVLDNAIMVQRSTTEYHRRFENKELVENTISQMEENIKKRNEVFDIIVTYRGIESL